MDAHSTETTATETTATETTARRGGLLVVLAAVALVASSCSFFVQATLEHHALHPDSRPWWCHSAQGDGGHGHDLVGDEQTTATTMHQTTSTMHHTATTHAMPVGDKGMLSWDDCLLLSLQLDAALEYALQYPTAGDAEAAGFYKAVGYATGMGTHHGNLGQLDGHFDPTRPEFLQYAGNGPGAQLVGMSWFVRTGGGPPAGFPGSNDHWHSHEWLCMRNGVVIGDGLTEEQCSSRGGVNTYYGDFWMVHAWIVPGMQHRPDIFVNHHPCLQPGRVAPFDDGCWQMSQMHASEMPHPN